MQQVDVTEWAPSFAASRSDSERSAIELSERILRADSATQELERWCQQHSLGDGRIVVLCERGARPQRLDDASLDALAYPAALKHALFRCVRLATVGLVVAKVLNWYFPESLTAEMREQLLTTDAEDTGEPAHQVIANVSAHCHLALAAKASSGCAD